MKKYLVLLLHYCFYITTLIFLPKDTALFIAILLISILALENIFYTILPMAILFVLPFSHIYILLSIFLIHCMLYYFLNKNRFYALGIYLLSTLTAFIVLFILNGFSIENLKNLCFLFVLYSIINLLYVYQKTGNKTIIIPYNSRLIQLTLILGYLFILVFHHTPPLLVYLLFMQFFIIEDIKYNILFAVIYTMLLAITHTPLEQALMPVAVSFFPPIICLTLDYTNYLWIFSSIYSMALLLTLIRKRKLTIENDYINTLFDDFNKYLETINSEFNKNNKLIEFKKQKINEISQMCCNQCHKTTLCKTNINKRYSFISAGILGMKQNVYDCPYYNTFSVNINLSHLNKAYEYSGIKELGFELSFLYNQSLAIKKEYTKFINLLNEYSYTILELDINMASSALYFSIKLDKNKPIIENLLLKCAYKAFGEELELKLNNDIIYFFKKPKLKITYAHTILAKSGNLMSGDNYYIKKDYNSSYIFALSDGMGSGFNAYTESSDTLKTIASLSSYHFRIKTILKLLEDIYELRSNYDRYATLDFLNIDTANCKIHLYKMGSTTTYILHNQQLTSYENQTLPLKLDDINSAYELDIYSGDFIFLLSDGISDFITNEEFASLCNCDASADEMCYSIIEYLRKKEKDRLKDDLSLIVIKAI